MLTLEVAVECEKCGLYLDAYDCQDGMDVDNFLSSVTDWADDYSRCPDCKPVQSKCTWCKEQCAEELDEVGWRQFWASDGKEMITLCNHCAEKYDKFRS